MKVASLQKEEAACTEVLRRDVIIYQRIWDQNIANCITGFKMIGKQTPVIPPKHTPAHIYTSTERACTLVSACTLVQLPKMHCARALASPISKLMHQVQESLTEDSAEVQNLSCRPAKTAPFGYTVLCMRSPGGFGVNDLCACFSSFQISLALDSPSFLSPRFSNRDCYLQ